MENKKTAVTRFLFFVSLLLTAVCPDVYPQEIHSDSLDKGPGKPQSSAISLAASIGISDFHQRDRYLSPFTFGGTNFASRLSFQANTESKVQKADLFFTKGAINSDAQPRDVTRYAGQLSYSLIHSVNTTHFAGRPLDLLVGGGISSFVMNTDFFAIDEYGNKTYDQSWYWSHSLNLVLSGEYGIEEGKKLAVLITAPVVALVTRPENGHWLSLNNLDVSKNFLRAAANGQMEYVWSSFDICTDLEYCQSVSNHFDLLVTYSFRYVSSDRPASMLSMGAFMNNLTLGIAWVQW